MLRMTLPLIAAFVLAAPAAADIEGRWGAVAFGSPAGRGGFAANYDSPAEASQAALDQCETCTQTLTVYRACAAAAASKSGNVATATNRYKNRAIARALELCTRQGESCELVADVCTTH